MADQSEYVTVLKTNDVLFGRGSGPNDHEGNIRFRDMVAQRKGEYMATNHRQTKAKIARSIVDAVFTSDGRFLKKLEPAESQKLGFGNGVEVYSIVDDATVMEKAKQALRQNREKAMAPVNSAVESNATNMAQGAMMGMHPRLSGSSNGQVPMQERLSGASAASMAAAAASMAAMPRLSGTSVGGISAGGISAGAMSAGGFSVPGLGTLPRLSASSATGHLPPQHPRTSPQQYDYVEPLAGRNMTQMPPTGYGGGNNQIYHEDEEGYATYTTTLEDPDDAQIVMERKRLSSITMASGGSRRSSLLGGRKDAGNRPETMPTGDVWRRDSGYGHRGSMQMSELMESFKAMSTAGDFNSSTDTIGTIEGNPYGASQMSGLSNMSIVSMSSAMSLFKGAPNDVQSVESGDSPNADQSSGRETVSSSEMVDTFDQVNPGGHLPQTEQVRPSLTTKDAFTSLQLSSLMQGPMDGSSSILGMENSASSPRHVNSLQRNPDSLNSLGSSTMSALRASDGNVEAHSIFDINKSSEGRVLPAERN